MILAHTQRHGLAVFSWVGIPAEELFEYVCQDNNLAHELMVGEQEFIDRQKMIVP